MPAVKKEKKLGAKVGEKKTGKKESAGTIFRARPRRFGIGGDVPPRRDLRRFLKWPRYVVLQRQRRVLQQRMKLPPALNQFTKTLDKSMAVNLFRFLAKYKPEDKLQQMDRLKKQAEATVAGSTKPLAPPVCVKFGLNAVVRLIEQKAAKLVVIAHDVDPIELVVYLPTLCTKLDIPYCIVKGKARLGQIVHKKTASCLAVTEIRNEDKAELAKLVESVRLSFNERYEELRKQWGSGVLGMKSQAMIARRERMLQKELAQKFG